MNIAQHTSGESRDDSPEQLSPIDPKIALALRASERAGRLLDGGSGFNFRFPEGRGYPAGHFELSPKDSGSYKVNNDDLGLTLSFSADGSSTVERFTSGKPEEALLLVEKVLSTVEEWLASDPNYPKS